ncbi:MAG: C40 family peptidase [Clostridiales bacterium]|nr:C40 family peptidase [Clostridiales bacterium]
MRRGKAVRAAIFISSALLYLSMPNITAEANELIPAEEGIAGISYSLHQYQLATQQLNIDASKQLSDILNSLSPLANLGVSIASNYVNVRSQPSTESQIVGKLYRGCAADILERLDGGWVRIKSGDVEGYIAANYLVTGRDAEKMADEYATKTATVTTETLRVRENQSTDSKIITLIPGGETYIVLKEHEQWAEILLGTDEQTGRDYTGFVSKDYIDIKIEFKKAISIEEENRIRRQQEEAERAEAERKRKLAEEEALRKEAERKAKEAAAKKAAQANQKTNTSTSSSSSSKSTTSGNVSGIRNEIVSYALKFVGNPYKWGGVSLTKGADCSGFVQTIFAQFGYKLDRVSRDQAKTAGIVVKESERQPGDLIFYTNNRGTVNHVAIYIGNDRVVHAANSRQGIITSKYNYRDVYRVRRVIY